MTHNQTQLLDKILKILRDNKGNPFVSEQAGNRMTELAIELTVKKLKVDKEIAQALFDTLVADKYAITTNEGIGYSITAKGILFNENEGYRCLWWAKNARTILQALQAFALALGSLAALGLLILEIQKYHANCLC